MQLTLVQVVRRRNIWYYDTPPEGPVPPSAPSTGISLNVPPRCTLGEAVELAKRESPEAFRTPDGGGGEPLWVPILIRASDWEPYDQAIVPVCVDENGEALWNVSTMVAQLGSVREAVELEILDAHAGIIGYFCPVGGADGGEEMGRLLDSWATFRPWLHILVGAGAKEVVERVASLVRKHWRRWHNRGAAPMDWANVILSRRRWEAAELARILGINEGDAVACLAAFSYTEMESDTGQWRFEPSAAPSNLLGPLLRYKNLPSSYCLPPEEAE